MDEVTVKDLYATIGELYVKNVRLAGMAVRAEDENKKILDANGQLMASTLTLKADLDRALAENQSLLQASKGRASALEGSD